ncbi:RnfABCDGE type electron transport complex subunit G [Spirochaetia bacterium 38H-sp]|uniref:Ion-translocating oxidoreductase complex subunit G n=1 Tax=Rarispira pelagica TaxID=3141764 RepID=A0ABU9UD75_9SPIR
MLSKIPSTPLTMVLVLAIIAALSAALLAVTDSITAPVIEQVQEEKQAKAVETVLPETDNNPAQHPVVFEDAPDLIFFPASKREKPVGVAVRTYTDNGFSGRFWIMVGFLPDGSIYDTLVLQHAETPGLGQKMTKEKFKKQFRDKNPKDFVLKVKKDGGDVDAITAATISSRAYCDAIERAYNAFIEHKNELLTTNNAIGPAEEAQK